MNSSGTPQSMLYQMRGQHTAPSDGNGSRNRSAEQQYSSNSGNPMNYMQFLNGQDPSLGRYTPPTLSTQSPTSPQWNNNQGGYGYNLPTAFGGFGGFSQYSQQPQQSQGDMPPSFSMASGGQNQSQPASMPPSYRPPPMGGMFNPNSRGTPIGRTPQGFAKPALAPSQPPATAPANNLSYEQMINMMRTRGGAPSGPGVMPATPPLNRMQGSAQPPPNITLPPPVGY